MNTQSAQSLQKFIKSRKPATFHVEQYCFDKQLEFIQDKSQFVTAVTSRRAGKSTACVFHLLHTAITYPKTVSFYITFARIDAKGIVWPLLHELNRELKLNGISNESDLTFKFPNSSVIRLGGAATQTEIDRFRGYAIKLAYVDEAQRFGFYLKNLIDDVLVPACFDYKGSIRLIGTPGPTPVGYFYDASIDPKTTWSKHHWTMWDNPWLERKRGEGAQAILEQECLRKGVSEDDPTIQRECFGRWSNDPNVLVFKYSSSVNHFEELPSFVEAYKHVIGIDIGFDDADAIAVLTWHDKDKRGYLVEEVITHKQGITELARQVETLITKYKPQKLILDTGGLGKKIAEEITRRWHLPIIAAEKQRKFENIELLNDAMRTAKFMAKKNSRFAQDCMLLEWDKDKMQTNKDAQRMKIKDSYHSDICDAVLYGFRELYHWTHIPEISKPKWGSNTWAKAEEERLFQEALEHHKDQVVSNDMEWL